jgi:uncharacterized protein YciI
MLVVFHGLDRPDTAELRASTRSAHLEFQSYRTNLVGGRLHDQHGNVVGTLLIFHATDLAGATAEMADDPYVQAGLFERVSICEFTAVDWPATAPD